MRPESPASPLPHSRGPGSRARALLAGLAATAALALPLAGCKADGMKAHEYTMRGQVRQLPEANRPGSGLLLAHEAIDGFVGRDGKAVGMDPMVMDFPVAPGVSLDGIAVTDVVEVVLAVDWDAKSPVEITSVRELPAGTKLVFRAAEPERGP